MAMSAVPCSSFFPMVFDEIVFCSMCGFSSEYHLTDPVVDRVTQQPADELLAFPSQMDHQWNNLLLPVHAALDDDDNNVVCNSLSNQLLQDENVKHRVFSQEQVRRMVHKACALRWNLKGLSQDAEIDQFCKEIGVARVQFNKWVYRTRKRLGWPCGSRSNC